MIDKVIQLCTAYLLKNKNNITYHYVAEYQLSQLFYERWSGFLLESKNQTALLENAIRFFASEVLDKNNY
ncbi:MAG: hypothetical protein AB7F64_04550 [Gammaproteobacteria bacterium]